MPWRESDAMDQRLRFVGECLAGVETMTGLCEAYGVSRRTGYKWLERYRERGPAGLEERSRAPHRHGRATSAALVDLIVQVKLSWPAWGPRKIVAWLGRRHPELEWPSHSTAGEILKRAGLVERRRRVRRAPGGGGELTVSGQPNHVWAIDHKGWVSLGDGSRCEPLTITDDYSRYALAISAGRNTRASEARPVMERVFREYGLPEVIRSDNGVPFSSTSVTGLSALSVWWIKLGVRPERIARGKPQQNGRHERFHGTLLQAMRPPEHDRPSQAERFEAFRRDYNHERPHEALGQLPPACLYTPSHRPMPRRLPEPDYPLGLTVRRIRTNGELKWRGALHMVCSALAGERIGVEQTDHGWRLWFHQTPIAHISQDNRRVLPI
jgi:transposase InsO family protein